MTMITLTQAIEKIAKECPPDTFGITRIDEYEEEWLICVWYHSDKNPYAERDYISSESHIFIVDKTCDKLLQISEPFISEHVLIQEDISVPKNAVMKKITPALL